MQMEGRNLRQNKIASSICPLAERPEHAFLVAVDQDESESLWSVEDSLSELGTLARTAGAEVVGTMTQRIAPSRCRNLYWQRASARTS